MGTQDKGGRVNSHGRSVRLTNGAPESISSFSDISDADFGLFPNPVPSSLPLPEINDVSPPTATSPIQNSVERPQTEVHHQHSSSTGGQPNSGGNHVLQDYQMQLMLLEKQNKKRIMMARQEQDSVGSIPRDGQGGSGPNGQLFQGAEELDDDLDHTATLRQRRMSGYGTNEDLSADDLSSLPGTAIWIINRDDGSFIEKSKAPRRRKRFNPEQRPHAATVRKCSACEQCRARKVKVRQPVM